MMNETSPGFQKDENFNKIGPSPRSGWDEAFMLMHENGDGRLLIDDVFEDESFFATTPYTD